MSSPQTSTILSFEDARHLVERHAAELQPPQSQSLDLLEAAGRVLAEPIHADRDFPAFARATRDGYAVRCQDVENAPTDLDVIGEIRAGAADPTLSFGPGQAISIMTGAAVPQGADAVVMVEHTLGSQSRIQVQRRVLSGENIVPQGAEARNGQQLLLPGTLLGYAEIALAASVGRSRVAVYAKPRVAVLSTGDEVVNIDENPGSNQIRNSNSYSLAAQIRSAGGEPVLLPIAPDEPVRLRELLCKGLECDLLLVTGGVSMGKYDLVEQVLSELKAEFLFTGVLMQPGKPLVFGRLPFAAQERKDRRQGFHQYFFGLPGNPVSTMVTFELFARPFIEALAGRKARALQFTHARLKKEIRTKIGLSRFLPAILTGEFERSEVELVPWQGSGDIGAVVRSTCFVVVPPDRDHIASGEWVPVILKQ